MAAHRLLPELPTRAWLVLGGDTLSALGSGLTMPFLVVYLHRVRGIDLTLAGLALSTIAVASFGGNVLGGWLSDRYGPRRTLMVSLLFSAGGSASLAFAASVPAAFAATACLGLGNSIAWPALDALLATSVEEGQRSSVFALRHATLNLGFGGGALLAATVVVVGSLRSFQLLYLLDAASFLAFLPLLAALRGVGDLAEGAEERNGSYRDVVRDRAFLAVWGLCALFVVVGFGQYEAALPPYATSTGGVSAHALGYVFAANTLGVAILQLPVLRLTGSWRRTSSLAYAALALAAAWSIAIVGAHGGGVAVFALAMAVLALGETLSSPAFGPIVNDLAPDHLRGRYNGAFVLAYTTGFMVGPALAGVGLRFGDGTPFFATIAAGALLAAGWAVALARRLPAAVNRTTAVVEQLPAAEPA